MGTPYPTPRELTAIQRRADAGDTSARDYMRLLNTFIHIMEDSNGIALARGMVGEHNDVYGQAIDDALSELVPVILDIAAGGFESLRFYARPEQAPASDLAGEDDDEEEEKS